MFRATNKTTVNAPSVTDNLTALAGGGQAGATALTGDTNYVTVCATAGDSALLPDCEEGATVFVQNLGAASLNVFPASGELINALAADAAFAVGAGKSCIFAGRANGKWATHLSA